MKNFLKKAGSFLGKELKMDEKSKAMRLYAIITVFMTGLGVWALKALIISPNMPNDVSFIGRVIMFLIFTMVFAVGLSGEKDVNVSLSDYKEWLTPINALRKAWRGFFDGIQERIDNFINKSPVCEILAPIGIALICCAVAIPSFIKTGEAVGILCEIL